MVSADGLIQAPPHIRIAGVAVFQEDMKTAAHGTLG
jgi:hypothetical protein